MKKIIFDCDNTMGIKNRDIDDGLALMYLLGREDVELLGITTTYGNDSIENVYEKTKKLLEDIQREDISLFKGRNSEFVMVDYVDLSYNKSDSNDIKSDYKSNKSAEFIVEEINKNPGEISILATGSLQNIYDALSIDNSICNKIKEIVVMGGITGPLHFGDRQMKELNFTVCKDGAFQVLNKFPNLSILTGNNCMDSRFGIDDLKKSKDILSNRGKKVSS